MINRMVFTLGSPEMVNRSNKSSEDVKEVSDDIEQPKDVKDDDRESHHAALLVADPADFDDDVFSDESSCAIGQNKCGPGIRSTCWSEIPCLCDMDCQQLPETGTNCHKMRNSNPVKTGKFADSTEISGTIARSKKILRDIGTPYSAKSAVERRSKNKLFKLELPKAIDIYHRRLRDRICRKREPQFHVTQQEEMMRVFEMEMEELEENDEVFEGWSLPSSPVYLEH